MAHPVGLYATSRNNTVQPQHGGGGGGGSGSGGGNGGGGGGGGGSGGGNGGGLYATSANNTVQPQGHGGGGHGGGHSGGSGGHPGGHYNPGGGGSSGGGGGSSGAVNWQWRCSNEENMLPTTTDITAAQSQILQGVGGARFSSGNVVGCYTQEFVVNDGSALLAVYSSFTCGWQPSDDRCSACLNDAVKRMQDECPGRAGAAFSDNVNCCLRYELYNFCGTADECRV
ncbi:hypothetical protein LINGRAPRIM_LOCUS1349 [Linum grandiflorum]